MYMVNLCFMQPQDSQKILQCMINSDTDVSCIVCVLYMYHYIDVEFIAP